MSELLIKIIPLDLASTLSPIILALTIALLAKKEFGLKRALALGIGSLAVAIIIAILGVNIGINIQDVHNNRVIDNVIDFILALVFLFFGFYGLFHQENTSSEKKLKGNQTGNFLKWLAIGFLISVTNFDAVILNFSAAKEIGQAQIYEIQKILLLIMGMIFFIAPILLPLAIYLIMPKLAQKILTPLNNFLTKYGRYITAVIFFAFAIYLFYQALKNFF